MPLNSTFNTIAVPQRIVDAGGQNDAGALLAQAPRGVYVRVLIRNLSVSAEILLTFDPATVQAIPLTSNTYELPAGQADAFVLAPEQRLIASSSSANARAGIAVSEALPRDV